MIAPLTFVSQIHYDHKHCDAT